MIGVDLGGTKIEAALVDRSGVVVDSRRRPTGPERGAEGVLADLVALTRECQSASAQPVAGVGVGVAGQVDPVAGTVLRAPNLTWRDFPLRSRLEEALGSSVCVINDVQAATFGEWTCGAGRGHQDIVCLFVGTGVGGGIVSRGSLVRGCDGTAGELGHMTIDRHGPPCSCGNRGCLEALASGWAMGRRAQDAVTERPKEGAALLALAAGEARDLTASVVAVAARDGDPLALRLVRQTGEALGAGIATVVNALNPCLVILGGGVIAGMPQLVEMAEAEARRRALEVPVHSLRVVKADLGKHAGTVGAALWARRRLE